MNCIFRHAIFRHLIHFIAFPIHKFMDNRSDQYGEMLLHPSALEGEAKVAVHRTGPRTL